jgi:hypothetical protein
MARKEYHSFKYPGYFLEPDRDKWQILRTVAKTTISSKAQLKLEWIIFYYTVAGKRALKTAIHFGKISRE